MRLDRCEPTITRLVPQQLALLLLAPVLLWPAIVNGGAFFFPDTPAYVRSIDALAVRTLGRASDWTTPRTIHVARPTAHTAHAAPGAAVAPSPVDAPILTGRSPFYGLLAYLGVLLGSFWWVIAVQALVATAVLIGVVRHAVDPAQRRGFALAVAGAVALMTVTPLPFFVAMLMPDMFAGLAIVAAATLLIGWRRERAIGRAGWIAVAGYGALSHSATTLILLSIGAGAVLVRLAWRRATPVPAGMAAVIGAALLGLAGDSAFSIAIERMTGNPPIRPPFVTARLTADGVGTRYARAHCATERWVVCRYVDRLPLHSDSFLWSPSPANGVFMTIPVADQRALSAEQMPFLIAVLRDRPWETLRSSAGAVTEQLTQVGMGEFHYSREEFDGFVEKMPAGLVAQIRATASYRGAVPIAAVVALTWPLMLASVAIIGWAWRRRGLRDQAMIGLWITAGWIVNDAICGALSTPHERYHMRVVWALPLIAMTIVAAAVRQRRGAAPVPTETGLARIGS